MDAVAMRRVVLVAILLVSGRAMAQQRVEVTVKPAPMVDWNPQVQAQPTGLAAGIAAMSAAVDDTTRAKPAPAVAPAPARQAPAAADVDAIMEIASWPDAAVALASDGGLMMKVDGASLRAYGPIRVVRWGLLSQGQGYVRTAIVDCSAKTIDPSWPRSKARPVSENAGYAPLFARVCPAPSVSKK